MTHPSARPNPPTVALKDTLESTLSQLSRHIGTPLALDKTGRCTFSIGGFSAPITVEWVDEARLVAVHTATLEDHPDAPSSAISHKLLKIHAFGGLTLGCQYWRIPDDTLRVGTLLFGPALGEDELLEAIGRVVKYNARLETLPSQIAERG